VESAQRNTEGVTNNLHSAHIIRSSDLPLLPESRKPRPDVLAGTFGGEFDGAGPAPDEEVALGTGFSPLPLEQPPIGRVGGVAGEHVEIKPSSIAWRML
jgi:hypothetical protein